VLVTSRELPELFRGIVSTLQRVIRHDYTSLALLDPMTGLLKIYALDFPGHQGFFKAEIGRAARCLSGRSCYCRGEDVGGQGSGTRHLPKRNRAATAGGGNANNLLHPAHEPSANFWDIEPGEPKYGRLQPRRC